MYECILYHCTILFLKWINNYIWFISVIRIDIVAIVRQWCLTIKLCLAQCVCQKILWYNLIIVYTHSLISIFSLKTLLWPIKSPMLAAICRNTTYDSAWDTGLYVNNLTQEFCPYTSTKKLISKQSTNAQQFSFFFHFLFLKCHYYHGCYYYHIHIIKQQKNWRTIKCHINVTQQS